jgi:hypothetical protein
MTLLGQIRRREEGGDSAYIAESATEMCKELIRELESEENTD